MNLVEKFNYIKMTREDGGEDGRKYVDPSGNKLPSVTTILDKTKTKESKQALDSWRKSIGNKKADDITNEAAFRGTMMHSFLEKYLRDGSASCGSNIYHKHSYKMAGIIYEQYLKPFLNEIWGLETGLYYPNIYAGTTDLCGVYQGQPSIVDFKQSNKIKTDDRVVDYKLQLVAYAIAHNEIYGTNIKQGVILMCTKDFVPLRWVLTGQEFLDYEKIWWQRVAEYYQV